MEKFHIKGSTYIPNIDFDPDTGVLEISGESYHEYTTEFFRPVFEWIDEYLALPPKVKITMNFKMTYFNTSSSRRFIEILTRLEDHVRKHEDADIEVNWYYEENDIDMLESGEEYAEDVDLKFNLIPISNKQQ
jgi:hypothetical protein